MILKLQRKGKEILENMCTFVWNFSDRFKFIHSVNKLTQQISVFKFKLILIPSKYVDL